MIFVMLVLHICSCQHNFETHVYSLVGIVIRSMFCPCNMLQDCPLKIYSPPKYLNTQCFFVTKLRAKTKYSVFAQKKVHINR